MDVVLSDELGSRFDRPRGRVWGLGCPAHVRVAQAQSLVEVYGELGPADAKLRECLPLLCLLIRVHCRGRLGAQIVLKIIKLEHIEVDILDLWC